MLDILKGSGSGPYLNYSLDYSLRRIYYFYLGVMGYHLLGELVLGSIPLQSSYFSTVAGIISLVFSTNLPWRCSSVGRASFIGPSLVRLY